MDLNAQIERLIREMNNNPAVRRVREERERTNYNSTQDQENRLSRRDWNYYSRTDEPYDRDGPRKPLGNMASYYNKKK